VVKKSCPTIMGAGRGFVVKSCHGRCIERNVCVLQQLNGNKHADRVPTAPQIIGEESVVQRHKALFPCHLGQGLDGPSKGQFAGNGVGLLACHPILGCLQRHSRNGVDKATGHGRTEYVGDRVTSLIECIRKEILELVQRRDLEDANHHSPRNEGIGSPPKGGDTLLSGDATEDIPQGLVIPAFVGW
jgi:hypothetical protein